MFVLRTVVSYESSLFLYVLIYVYTKKAVKNQVYTKRCTNSKYKKILAVLRKIVAFSSNIKQITAEADVATTAEYEFQITPKAGTFDNVREQCHFMGGDLITTNMLPQGEKKTC